MSPFIRTCVKCYKLSRTVSPCFLISIGIHNVSKKVEAVSNLLGNLESRLDKSLRCRDKMMTDKNSDRLPGTLIDLLKVMEM